MSIVIDTNVLVSHLFWPQLPIRPMVKKLLRSGKAIHSTETFAELMEVVLRPKFDKYMSMAKRELFLASFQNKTTHILITERVNACRDPKDNKFLELAVCGKADLILSGDDDLLALNPFKGIRIVNPAEF